MAFYAIHKFREANKIDFHKLRQQTIQKYVTICHFWEKSGILDLRKDLNDKIWQGSPLVKRWKLKKSILLVRGNPHRSRTIHSAKTSVKVGILLPWPGLDPLLAFLPRKSWKTTQKWPKNSRFWPILAKITLFWQNFGTENPQNISFGSKINFKHMFSYNKVLQNDPKGFFFWILT